MGTKRRTKIEKLVAQLEAILLVLSKEEKKYASSLKKVHPNNIHSAKNLIHYNALRLQDLSAIQHALGGLGLPRLSKIQSNVLLGIKQTKQLLETHLGKKPKQLRTKLTNAKAERFSKRNTKRLLGYRSKNRHTRIMVTMPSEAAEDYQLVENMIAAGMNCARINCAHDDEKAWLSTIQNVRKASRKLKKKCKVAMDLAGPKLRTGVIEKGPKVIKLKPTKDERGRVKSALTFLLTWEPSDSSNYVNIPLLEKPKILESAKNLYFLDARNKKRKAKIVAIQKTGLLVSIKKTCYLETGMELFLNKKLKGGAVIIGELPPLEIPILLTKGDLLVLTNESHSGQNATYDEVGKVIEPASIPCTYPGIFSDLKKEESVLFDDGKIGGKVLSVDSDNAIIEITHPEEKIAKLRADKGINLPNTKISSQGLTSKDIKDLKFVVKHADVFHLSFVNTKKDVKQLRAELAKLNSPSSIGVILKIETQSAFSNIIEILLEAMRLGNVGIMIARGDLAVEIGWENIGRVQQEILAICEAGHIPTIWATQVLENLAKKGIPSRAEITDALKAQQSDCVMLNKGPYIISSIKFLNSLLKSMSSFQYKSFKYTPKLNLKTME